MCVRASMKAAKPLHIVLATNPNPTRARGYPLNINPKPDPKPDSISGPAGSGRVADLYLSYKTLCLHMTSSLLGSGWAQFIIRINPVGTLQKAVHQAQRNLISPDQ